MNLVQSVIETPDHEVIKLLETNIKLTKEVIEKPNDNEAINIQLSKMRDNSDKIFTELKRIKTTSTWVAEISGTKTARASLILKVIK